MVVFASAVTDVFCATIDAPVRLGWSTESSIEEASSAVDTEFPDVLDGAATATEGVVSSKKLRLKEGLLLGKAKCICVKVVVVAYDLGNIGPERALEVKVTAIKAMCRRLYITNV